MAVSNNNNNNASNSAHHPTKRSSHKRALSPQKTTNAQYNNSNNTMMLPATTTTTTPASADTFYATGAHGALHKRIRTPAEHDVLSGRGGGINAHPGNVQFREWVRVRKNDYNLAPTKAEKCRIAKQVIDLVRESNGRFLQKEAAGAGGWWVELDEERVMAKTSQALREGAPQIRAAHQHALPQKTTSRRRKANLTVQTAQTVPTKIATTPPASNAGGFILPTPIVAVSQPKTVSPKRSFDNAFQQPAPQKEALVQLQANARQAQQQQPAAVPSSAEEPAEKRVRVEYQGHTLRPADASPVTAGLVGGQAPPPLDLSLIPSPNRQLPNRLNSLALPELQAESDDWQNYDFVNPFEDDDQDHLLLPETLPPLPPSPARRVSQLPRRNSSSSVDASLLPPRVGIFHRESSTASDMGGVGALLSQDDDDDDSVVAFLENHHQHLKTDSKTTTTTGTVRSLFGDIDDEAMLDPLSSFAHAGIAIRSGAPARQ